MGVLATCRQGSDLLIHSLQVWDSYGPRWSLDWDDVTEIESGEFSREETENPELRLAAFELEKAVLPSCYYLGSCKV
jgi:hypothetical protein